MNKDINKVVFSSLLIVVILVATVAGYIFINRQVKQNIKEQDLKTKVSLKLKKSQFKSQPLAKPSIEPKNIVLKSEPKAEAKTTILIKSDKLNYRPGDVLNFQVVVKANGQVVDGAEFALDYNPELIKVNPPQLGTFFSLYPQKQVDNNKGRIRVIALLKPEENKKCFTETIASFSAVVLKPGQLKLNFVKDKTQVAGYGGQNLLKETQGLNLNINE